MPTLDLKYMAVRHLNDTAIPFVFNSWIQSYRWSDRDNDSYFREMVSKIKKTIRENRLMVAVMAEEPDCFVGWICGKSGVLNYVYVKSMFRRDGVAKALVEKVCGPTGIYTSKSRNNSFMRYLDEKGFEHGEEERDTGGFSKNDDSRARQGVKDGQRFKAVSDPRSGADSRRGDGPGSKDGSRAVCPAE